MLCFCGAWWEKLKHTFGDPQYSRYEKVAATLGSMLSGWIIPNAFHDVPMMWGDERRNAALCTNR